MYRYMQHLDNRINRNIVECKYKEMRQGINTKSELIETLWNVNHYEWQKAVHEHH